MKRIKDLWENYKVVVILDLVLLFLFLVILAGETIWSVSVLEKPQFQKFRISGTDLVAHTEYPSQILYSDDQPHTLNIWLTCEFSRQKCPTDIVISSGGKNLLFAIDQDVPRWMNALDVPIQPGQKAVAVQVARTDAASQQTLDEQITITVSGATSSQTSLLGALQLEGKQNAVERLWFIGLAGQAGVFISILGIPITWLVKQLDDEKKREKQATIDQALDQFDKDVIRGSISDFFKKWNILCKDWSDWTKKQQDDFKEKFSNFLMKDFLSQIEKDMEHIQKNSDAAEKLFRKIAPGKKNDVLDKLEKALNKQDVVAAVSLFQTNPEVINLVSAIIARIPEEIRQTAFTEIDPKLLLSSKRLKYLFGFPVNGLLYTPEEYPLEARFDNISRNSPQLERDDALQAWLRSHGLALSPFSDAQSPYIQVDDQIDLRDTLVGLFRDQSKPGQDKLIFQADWDLRAGFYDYCRGLSQEQGTFFVLLAPALWHGFENANSKEIILHAVAQEWLNILVLDHSSFFELNKTLREALCRLLVWHCGSFLGLQMTIDELYQRYGEKIASQNLEGLLETISQTLKGSTTVDLQPSEMNVFLGLRPVDTTQTRILCSSIDLDNQVISAASLMQTKLLDSIAGWLKTLHMDIICFILDNSQPGMSLSEEDLVKLCNDRLVACSDKTINGFDELFVPHTDEPAEFLLARKAHGSPGEMIRLGQTLLLNHCRNHLDQEYLDIQELLDLKA